MGLHVSNIPETTIPACTCRNSHRSDTLYTNDMDKHVEIENKNEKYICTYPTVAMSICSQFLYQANVMSNVL